MALPQPIDRVTNRAPMANGRGADIVTVSPAQVMEQVLIKGDLRNLSEEERARYYTRVCESVGLNPLTRPLEYITLNGKLTLYARKDCTDQLRRLHGISVEEISVEELGDIYVFVGKFRDKTGRTDVARGAVSTKGLSGEALANAIMKGETKCKRRGTLSMAGLGLLDESEVEDIPPKRKSSASAKRDGTDAVFNEIRAHISHAANTETLETLRDSYAQELADMPTRWAIILSQEFEARWLDVGGSREECPYPAMDDQG